MSALARDVGARPDLRATLRRPDDALPWLFEPGWCRSLKNAPLCHGTGLTPRR